MLINKIKILLKQKRYRWFFTGVLLSFIGPFGEWVFLRTFQAEQTNTILLTYVYTELLTLLCFSVFGYYLGKKADDLEHLAYHDSLTGLFSRGYILAKFEELLITQRRYKHPLSIMLLDLDYFKKVNDRFGHLVGDKTLKAVASSIQKSCRESDIAGRYGGEEILLICQNISLNKAKLLAERIRSDIESLSEMELGYPGPQTVSIGLVNIPYGNSLQMNVLINLVDEALYSAKKKGRNQICIASVASLNIRSVFTESEIQSV